MPIVGGYSIDLYCDCPKCVGEDTRNPGSFAGYDKRDTYQQAREHGWRFKSDMDGILIDRVWVLLLAKIEEHLKRRWLATSHDGEPDTDWMAQEQSIAIGRLLDNLEALAFGHVVVEPKDE